MKPYQNSKAIVLKRCFYLFSLTLVLNFRLAFCATLQFSCAQGLQRLSLEHPEKKARIVALFPDDYQPGELRDVLIYLHSFGSQPDKFFESTATGMHHLLQTERRALGIQEPISISLSLGAVALAGVPAHGLLHDDFVSPEVFWDPILKFVKHHAINIHRLQIFASSGGALNAFQMLRHQPNGIRVSTAVLSAFPNFTERTLPPAPMYASENDPVGATIRTQIEGLINKKLQDSLAIEIFPSSALHDRSLPQDTRILILSAQHEAMGYTPLNIEFASQASAAGYPLFHIVVSGAGHAGPYPNDVSVFFLENGRTGS